MKKSIVTFFICMLFATDWVVALTVDFKADTACFGSVTTLISLSAPSDSIQLFLWDLNGDGKFGEKTGDTLEYVFQKSGFLNVGLKVVTFDGRSKAMYKLILVKNFTMAFTFETGCRTQPTYFYNKSEVQGDSITSFSWNFGDETPTSSEQNPVHAYMLAGDFYVTLQVGTLAGCIDNISKTISIGELPDLTLQFSSDSIINEGDSVTVSAIGSFDSVYWSTYDTSYSIVIKVGGNYWVKAYKGGCYAERLFKITVKQFGNDPEIMTLFTPNGDGFNDRWAILNLSKVEPCEVNIFNRWGENVFQSSDYRNDWEGTFKGKPLTNDTYYYFVRCLDSKLYQGTVNILK